MKLKQNHYIGYIAFFFLGMLFSTPLEAQISCSHELLGNSALERVESQSATVAGKIYVFAGFLEKLQITDVTEIYDPETDKWSLGAPMPTAVTHMGIAVVGMDVWILGGFIGNHPGVATNRVQIYNVPTDSWSEGPLLPNVVGSGAAVLNEGKVHFFGGLEADRQTDTGNHYVLDITDQAAGWAVAPPLPEPRNHLGAAAVDGIIYAMGGQFGHDVTFSDKSFVHAYDPDTETWKLMAKMPTKRSHFEPGTSVMGSEIIIVGGRNGAKFFDEVISYDTKTNTWSSVCNLPDKLLAPVGKVIGDELIVANGGVDGTCCPTSTTRKVNLLGEVLSMSTIKDTQLEGRFVFSPNPASDMLTIESDSIILEDDSTSIDIVDLNGKKLLHKDLTRADKSVQIAHLEHGVYFILFQVHEKTTSVRRLLKQ